MLDQWGYEFIAANLEMHSDFVFIYTPGANCLTTHLKHSNSECVYSQEQEASDTTLQNYISNSVFHCFILFEVPHIKTADRAELSTSHSHLLSSDELQDTCKENPCQVKYVI